MDGWVDGWKRSGVGRVGSRVEPGGENPGPERESGERKEGVPLLPALAFGASALCGSAGARAGSLFWGGSGEAGGAQLAWLPDPLPPPPLTLAGCLRALGRGAWSA